MVRRYELTDAQWELIAPLLPQRKRTGRPPREDRQVVNGILWRLRTGAPWRDVPAMRTLSAAINSPTFKRGEGTRTPVHPFRVPRAL